MGNPRIEFINKSTVLKDRQVEAVIPALQTQVSRDFNSAWGLDADLSFSHKHKPTPHTWWVGIFDDSNQADILGFHDLTDEGLPLAKVFARTSIKSGSQWTVTVSHELLETITDPDGNLFARSHPDRGHLYPYEVCDPCEDDKYGYKIRGILVSDFIYPTWFESFHKEGSTQFDHCNRIRGPFQKLPLGALNPFDIRPHRARRKRLSRARRNDNRTKLRETPREEWCISSLLRDIF